MLSPRDVIAVLEDREGLSGLHSHFAFEALAKCGYSAGVMIVIRADVTQKSNWSPFGHLGVQWRGAARPLTTPYCSPSPAPHPHTPHCPSAGTSPTSAPCLALSRSASPHN